MTFTEFFQANNLTLPVKITRESSKFIEKEIPPETNFKPFDLIKDCVGYWTEDQSVYMHRPMTRWCIAFNRKRRLIDLFSEPENSLISIKHGKTFYELHFETTEHANEFIKCLCSKEIDGDEYMRIYHNIPVDGYKYDEHNPILAGQLWIPNNGFNRPKIRIDSMDGGINATLIYSDGSTSKLTVFESTIAQFQYTDLNGKRYQLATN